MDNPVSIDAFATRFVGSGRPLHILFNNAGIIALDGDHEEAGESLCILLHGELSLLLRAPKNGVEDRFDPGVEAMT